MCTRHVTIPAAALALTLTLTSSVSAQYFGRNKVHYKKFQFQVLKTDRFDIYFYPEEREGVEIAARMSESWLTVWSDCSTTRYGAGSLWCSMRLIRISSKPASYTSTLRRLTNDAFADLQPAWSPDGRRIAFATDRFSTQLETLAVGEFDFVRPFQRLEQGWMFQFNLAPGF
jgi:WD40-like Beta Propeller Repeat